MMVCVRSMYLTTCSRSNSWVRVSVSFRGRVRVRIRVSAGVSAGVRIRVGARKGVAKTSRGEKIGCDELS